MDISSLVRERNRYNELSSNVSLLSSQLGNCIDSLEAAASKIGEYYTIDNVAYDNGKINKSREELISKKNILNSEVLPAISAAIDRINAEIRRLEEEERARQAALAAEAARAATASALSSKASTSLKHNSVSRMTKY